MKQKRLFYIGDHLGFDEWMANDGLQTAESYKKVGISEAYLALAPYIGVKKEFSYRNFYDAYYKVFFEITQIKVVGSVLFYEIEQSGSTSVPNHYWPTLKELTGLIAFRRISEATSADYIAAFNGVRDPEVYEGYLAGQYTFYPFATMKDRCYRAYTLAIANSDGYPWNDDNKQSFEILKALEGQEDMDIFYSDVQVGYKANFEQLCSIVVNSKYQYNHTFKVVPYYSDKEITFKRFTR